MSSHYEGALLEEMNDGISRLAEAMSGLIKKVDAIDKRLIRVEETVEVIIPSIKAAIADQSLILDNHESRLRRLEQ